MKFKLMLKILILLKANLSIKYLIINKYNTL